MQMPILSVKFAFGKNWERYIRKGLDDKALEKSRDYLKSFLGMARLDGKTFIDVGSGSGVHSLAAALMGAKVTSLDVDEDSVNCTRELAEKSNVNGWEVKQGSILDDGLVKGLGTYDIVYCWGVAHHTGNMYKVLENLAGLTRPGGFLYVAIYNRVEGKLGSSMWHKIKKTYNHSGKAVKKLMEWAYISIMFARIAVRFKDPFKEIRNYYEKRGMRWTTDLIDWLGGYPYEYARADEIFSFYRSRGMDLVNLKTTNHIGCNQFVFRKR